MKPSPVSVLILHHAIPLPGSGPTAESDAGVMDEVRTVADALASLGMPHRIASIRTLSELPALLQSSPEEVVFNLVENLAPRLEDASLVPALCVAFEKGYTGNDTVCQTLALDKWRTKGVLQATGIPVPTGVLVPPGQRPPPGAFRHGTVIVKPLLTDASEGIHADSVVPAVGPALGRAIRRVHAEFKHTALVEEFFGTRELNVSVIQRGETPEVLPIAEIEFRGYGKDRPHIVDYAAKWHAGSFEYQNTVRVIPAKLSPAVANRVRQCAVAAWNALGCRGYARVDLRLTSKNEFAVLEVNPNPDISPESGFAAALTAAGIPFAEFVKSMCQNAACSRQAHPQEPPKSALSSRAKRPNRTATIRYSCPEDRQPILDFIKATKFFRKNEIEIAKEVLEDALKHGPSGHYQSFTLLTAGIPVGWVCLGPTPCTEGTYDIYWLGVSPECQGKGYGRALLEHAESVIRKRHGRLIVIETSGQSLYGSTRGFYLSLGYRETARVPDFYGVNDPRVIYTKPLLFA
jgi:D-alanine-D-alanine ligase